MTTVSFTIPGRPFAKKRARSFYNPRMGRAVTVNDAGNVSFERQVGTIAGPLFPEPLDGPLRLTIIAVFEPAASLSARKRAAMMGRWHTQRPDKDNIEKACADGLNRIAWRDDAQVADGSCSKVWGPVAETRITVTQLEEPAP